jgi:hypothetical protein
MKWHWSSGEGIAPFSHNSKKCQPALIPRLPSQNPAKFMNNKNADNCFNLSLLLL